MNRLEKALFGVVFAALFALTAAVAAICTPPDLEAVSLARSGCTCTRAPWDVCPEHGGQP